MDEILENIVIENGLTKYTGGDVIVKLCIAIYDNGGSNDQLVKKVPESFKYLSTGDEITIVDKNFVVTNKRIFLGVDTLEIYSNYEVDEFRDLTKEKVIEHLEKNGFSKD